jgi:RNA polymerase sigma-70 factor (ECF subfamily)
MENAAADSPLSPTLLVRSATNGDGDAFRRLVEPHLAVALRASTLVLGSEAEAADAVQDALLSAWRDLPKLREPEAFGGWFRQIVVRSAMRQAKTRRRLVALDPQIAAPAADLDRAVEARQLERAFGDLESDDRLALTLRHLWQLSVREVAGLLGIPEGTVKSRTYHAMERLRAAYAAEGRR